MNSYVFAFSLFLVAVGLGTIIWALYFPRPVQWVTVDTAMCTKRLLGYQGDAGDQTVYIMLERDPKTDEERAWAITSHTDHALMRTEKAKEIIASCKQARRE